MAGVETGMSLSTIITAVFLFFFAAFSPVHCLENPQIDDAANLESAWQNASSVFDGAPSGLSKAGPVDAAAGALCQAAGALCQAAEAACCPTEAH